MAKRNGKWKVKVFDDGSLDEGALRLNELSTDAGPIVEIVLEYGEQQFKVSCSTLENSLSKLRTELDKNGIKLCINRFRTNAMVSEKVRDFRCYLAQPKQRVGPKDIVKSLDPAPVDTIGTANEARLAFKEYVYQLHNLSDLDLAFLSFAPDGPPERIRTLRA